MQQANAATQALHNMAETAEKTVEKLSKINTGSIDTNGIKKLADSLSSLGKIPDISNATSRTVSALARLATAGDKINTVNAALPSLTESLRKAMENFNKMPDISTSTNIFIKSIAQLANAGNKTEQTAAQLKALSQAVTEIFETMAKAPQINDATIRMMEALSRLASTGNRTSSSFRGMQQAMSGSRHGSIALGSALKDVGATLVKMLGTIKNVSVHTVKSALDTRKLSDAMTQMKTSVRGATSNMKSFVSQLSAAAGVHLSLYGAIRGLKNSVETASSLTEIQNVIDVTFGDAKQKIEDLAAVSITDFGMSELTTKQIAGRFQGMGKAAGFTTNKMADMSVELTKLAADMASFYDASQKVVAKSLESVFTGTTTPLRRYGLDITQATLQNWLLKKGIDASVQSMTQQEKILLRYAYVMENTASAQGDFARTANTWANQTRVLKQSFEVLGSTIGGVLINILKPFVTTLNKLMLKINDFAKVISESLGTIFGWKYEDSTKGIVNDFDEEMEDTADGLDKADENAKKLKRTILGFDQLNILSDNSDLKKNIDKLGDVLSASIDTGEWKSGGDTLLKSFDSDLDTLEKLGEEIGTRLTNAMNSINWEAIYQKAKNFGSGLASFLNGLISPELFSSLGSTIAGAINTVVNALGSFADPEHGFDFSNLGTSIGAAINSALSGIDWKEALTAAENWGKGIANFLNSLLDETDFELLGRTVAKFIKTAIAGWHKFVKKFKFPKLGEKIGQSINAFFDEMAEVDENGENGWQKLGKALTKTIVGIENIIIAALEEIDFVKIAQAIADLIGSINTKKISWKLGKIVNSLVNSFYTLVSNKEIWTNLGQKIADGINGFLKGLNEVDKKTKLTGWQALGKSIEKTITGLSETIITALDGVPWGDVAQGIADSISSVNWKEVTFKLGGLVTSLVTAFYELIKNKDTWIAIGDAIGKGINGIFSSLESKNKKTGLTLGETLGKTFTNAMTNLAAGINKFLTESDFESIGRSLVKFMTDLVGNINFGEIIASGIENIEPLINAIIDIIKGAFKGAWEAIKKNPAILFKPIGMSGGLLGQGISAAADFLFGNKEEKDTNTSKSSGGRNLNEIKKFTDQLSSDISSVWVSPELPVKAKSTVNEDTLTKWKTEIETDWVSPELPVGNKFKTNEEDTKEWGKKTENLWKDPKLGVSNKFNTSQPNINKWISDINNMWKDPMLKVSNDLKTNQENTDKWAKKIKGYWKVSKPELKVNNDLATDETEVGSWFSKISNWWGNRKLEIDVVINTIKKKAKDIVDTVAGWFGGGSETDYSGYSLRSSEAMPQYEAADLGWYAKGGLFNKASVIGVGEAGTEAVLPLTDARAMNMIADSISANASFGGLNEDALTNAVARGVAMAIMNNQQNLNNQSPINVTVKLENDEAIARAAIRGQEKLDYRYNPTPRYGY